MFNCAFIVFYCLHLSLTFFYWFILIHRIVIQPFSITFFLLLPLPFSYIFFLFHCLLSFWCSLNFYPVFYFINAYPSFYCNSLVLFPFLTLAFIPPYSLSPFKILSMFYLIHLCFYAFIIYEFFSIVHFKVACVLSCFLGSWSCYIYLFSCSYPRYLTICKSIYL